MVRKRIRAYKNAGVTTLRVAPAGRGPRCKGSSAEYGCRK